MGIAPALARILNTASSNPPAVGIVANRSSNGWNALAFEFYFSVLRKTPFRNIKSCHYL